MVKDSRITGFYKLSMQERIEKVIELTGISREELAPVVEPATLDMNILDHMTENVIGSMMMPFSIATNFRVNGRDYLVPMVLEEPSVVAAASNAARMAREKGGFTATDTGPMMIAQVQVVRVPNPYEARMRVIEAKGEILAL
ncbi:MAG: 3-hydroxy-3-methylglutaryl-CoA reductase, partial [Candidatus Thorarchaeota archaeon]